jgi:hypothetical protein
MKRSDFCKLPGAIETVNTKYVATLLCVFFLVGCESNPQTNSTSPEESGAPEIIQVPADDPRLIEKTKNCPDWDFECQTGR